MSSKFSVIYESVNLLEKLEKFKMLVGFSSVFITSQLL